MQTEGVGTPTHWLRPMKSENNNNIRPKVFIMQRD